MAKPKIALIQGGLGAEREVSLSTGAGFKQALVELGYEFTEVDAKEDLPAKLMKLKPDVALLALHGKFGEDGTVQGICEYLKIPYTGSGVLSSSLCMDKILSKQILISQALPTPNYEFLNARETNLDNYKIRMEYPVVVKPSREGSSVGISIVKEESELVPALKLAAKSDYQILIEEFIEGKEITVPILGDKALTPIEIEPKEDFYNYENKYTEGKTEYHLPARVSDEVLEEAKKISLAAFDFLRMRGYGRIDFRLSPMNKLYIMEANSLPGCTPTSLIPKSALHMGISFNELIETLIKDANLDYAGVD